MSSEYGGLESRVSEKTTQPEIQAEISNLKVSLAVGVISTALLYGLKGIADGTDSYAPTTPIVEHLALSTPLLFSTVVSSCLGRAAVRQECCKNDNQLSDEIIVEMQRSSKQYAVTISVFVGTLAALSYGSGRLVGCLIQYT